METKYTRYLFITILVIVALLSFLIIKPLLIIFLWSLILTYMFYPTYSFINRRLQRPSLSSFLTVLIMILVVTIPFVFIIKGISTEVFSLYGYAKTNLASGDISLTKFTNNCRSDDSRLCSWFLTIDNSVRTLLPQELMREATGKFLAAALNTTIDVLLRLPAMLFNIAISFFITFFLIRDWEKLRKSMYEFVPLKAADMEKILHRINSTTHSIIFATIMVAIIQGLLGMLGFWIAGLPNPILFGVIMGFFALLPLVGSAIVWVPAALFLIGKGVLFEQNMFIYQGLGLFLYGALIISTIDNFLRPKLAGDAAQIHPVVVIVGVIGGTTLMGFIGIFVGPVILSLLITLVTIALEKYHTEQQATLDKKKV